MKNTHDNLKREREIIKFGINPAFGPLGHSMQYYTNTNFKHEQHRF